MTFKGRGCYLLASKISKMESEILRRFYDVIQHAITNPIGVASLLHQEDVVGEVLLDEVSPTNKASPVEKIASIMRHVQAAIRVDPKSFWVFLSVLDQFTPSRYLAERMRQAVDLHTSAAQDVSSPAATSHDALEENVTVSEVYKKDFDAINRKFVSLHLRASRIMSKNNAITVQELKELLTSYPELELSLQGVETISEVMHVVQRHSSFINCSYLEHIAEEFQLPNVTREIDNYNKLVDDFCNNKIIQHSYMKPFTTNPPQYTMSSQTIKIKIMLEWNPESKTLTDIRSLLRKAFKGLSSLIHVDVISEGSITVICYAPHYLMGALVKMAEENKSMLLEDSVSYLSIGYTVVLGSGAQDKTALENKVHSLTQKNRSMMLSLIKLWEEEDKQLPLEKNIHDLQQENESLQRVVAQKNVDLQQTISTQRETVSTLEDELKLVRSKVKFLTQENTYLQNKCEDLQSLLPQSTEEKIRDLRQENSSLQLTVTTLQERCQELHLQLSQLVEMQSDIVSKQPLKKSTSDLEIQSELVSKTLKKITSDKPLEEGPTQLEEAIRMKKKPQFSETLLKGTGPPLSSYILIGPVDSHESKYMYAERLFGHRHSGATLTGVTADVFRVVMEQQVVEDIAFQYDVTTEQLESIFQGLRSNTTLRRLNIPRTRSPVDMSILSASLTVNNTLQDLTLSCDLDDHAMEQLSVGLRANRSVTKLTLQCCITDTGAQHLATMLAANTTIQELNLSSAYSDHIGYHRMQQLSTLQYSIRAQHFATMWAARLSSTYNDRTTGSDHAIEKLSAGLRANRSVTRLTLQCGITDTGAQHLATMLAANTTLQELDLSCGSITDDGVGHLSQVLQHNSSVTHLNLCYNSSITNTGAVALGEMLRVNMSLRELDLCGTSVGKKGATGLMEGLQHNQVLNELRLPRGLEEYCKKHKLYGSVQSIEFEFW